MAICAPGNAPRRRPTTNSWSSGMNGVFAEMLGSGVRMVLASMGAGAEGMPLESARADYLQPAAGMVIGARLQGIDLGRLRSSPGLPIVALDDSPFRGPVAERMRA